MSLLRSIGHQSHTATDTDASRGLEGEFFVKIEDRDMDGSFARVDSDSDRVIRYYITRRVRANVQGPHIAIPATKSFCFIPSGRLKSSGSAVSLVVRNVSKHRDGLK